MRPLPLVLALGLALPCAAIPTSFPEHEQKCAAAAGVTLTPAKGGEHDVKRAAWVCPVIVRGQVVDVETDMETVYHTRLVVHADATEKGSIPFRDVRVLIESDARSVSVHEPFLKMGDEVLLFLQTDAEAKLANGEYRPCLCAYTVGEDKLVSAVPASLEELPIKATLETIRRTVRAQTGCRP
jgi:hypothetical protein